MKFQLTMLSMLLTYSIVAQTYVDIPWRVGTITKKGKLIEGAIRLGGDLGAPWLNNSKVYFVTKENYEEGKKVKRKFITEYKPEDLDGYDTYTEDADDQRVEMKFVTHEILVDGMLKKKKIKAFLRISEQGTITIYSYVPKPSKEFMSTAQSRQENRQYALNHSTYYLQKKGEDIIPSADCVLVEYLEACPEVVAKIKSEAYGFKPKADRKKRKGLGKLMAKSLGDNVLENKIYKAVVDYNACVN